MTTRMAFQVRVDAQGPFDAGLEMETEVLEVTTFSGVRTPDKAWEFVDDRGHYHAFDDDGNLPTLDRHVQVIPCNHMHGDLEELLECGGTEVITVACKLCGEAVEPKYNTDHSPQYMPGRASWRAEIRGVHLHPGDKVSLAFSMPATGRVRWFGIGQVVAIDITESTYITRVAGAGPLARKH